MNIFILQKNIRYFSVQLKLFISELKMENIRVVAT